MTEAVFKNHEELAYLDLCKKIIETGNEKGLQIFISDIMFSNIVRLSEEITIPFSGRFCGTKFRYLLIQVIEREPVRNQFLVPRCGLVCQTTSFPYWQQRKRSFVESQKSSYGLLLDQPMRKVNKINIGFNPSTFFLLLTLTAGLSKDHRLWKGFCGKCIAEFISYFFVKTLNFIFTPFWKKFFSKVDVSEWS